jgi:hypothetical protein
MSTPFQQHVAFEEAVYAAFPRHPVPSLDGWVPQTWLERNAKTLFTNKTWPEIIGLRMMRNELDDSFISWIGIMPSEVVAYYLPSHLMFGSMLLWYGVAQNYVGNLVEGFVLPPPDQDAHASASEEIDMELGLAAGVAEYAEWRRRLYQQLTIAQRAVVGRFLDLHLDWAQRTTQYSERGLQFLTANRDYWLAPS